MKLATLADGTRDGHLVLVNREGTHWTSASDISPTLQSALDAWSENEARLRARAAQMEANTVPAHVLQMDRLLAPLPRAYEWIDGSAFLNHVRLVRKARGAEPPKTLEQTLWCTKVVRAFFWGPDMEFHWATPRGG